MLVTGTSGDEQLAERSHRHQEQADFGSYNLEIDLPQDVEIAFPFEAACSRNCEHDQNDRETERAC